MKRITAILLSAAMLLLLAACGNSAGNETENGSSAGQKETIAENTDTSAANNDAEHPSESSSEKGIETDSEGGSIVVYFSGTGNTREIAELMAQALNTDTIEIVPQEPYSSDDLNYNDDNCRANQEMNDDSARPAIAGDLSAVTEYDTVYLGYPIWWGTAPRIIQTFLESYDLSGKTVYTFCTSGGSGIEQSVNDLSEAYSDVNIVSGHRFSTGDSAETVQEWLDSLK